MYIADQANVKLEEIGRDFREFVQSRLTSSKIVIRQLNLQVVQLFTKFDDFCRVSHCGFV